MRKFRKILSFVLVALLLLVPAFQTAYALGTAAQAEPYITSLMEKKGWDTRSDAEFIHKTLTRISTAMLNYTPSQVLEKLDTGVQGIVVVDDNKGGGQYDHGSKIITISSLTLDEEILCHEMMHSITGLSPIKFGSFVYNLPNFATVGIYRNGEAVRARLYEGLTDFLTLRTFSTITLEATNFYDSKSITTKSIAQKYQGYYIEMGMVIPFQYAVGSSDIDKAYAGTGSEFKKFQSAFNSLYGSNLMQTLINDVDILTSDTEHLYSLTASQKKETYNLYKDYFNKLVTVLEKRLDKDCSTSAKLAAYKKDLANFIKFMPVFSETSYMNELDKRLDTLTAKVNGSETVSGFALESPKSTGSSITLSWQPVSGANSYSVYYSASKNSGYKKILSTAKTTATVAKLSSSKIYYFKVYANTGKTTLQKSSILMRCTLRSAPAVVSYELVNGNYKLTWSSVSNVSGYLILGAASADGEYTVLAQTTSAVYQVPQSSLTGTVYIKVQALGKDGVAGQASPVLTVTPGTSSGSTQVPNAA